MGQWRKCFAGCSARTVLQKYFITIMIMTVLMISIFVIFQMNNELIGVRKLEDLDNDALLGDYLLDSENCKIPNLSPYSKESMSVFKAWPSAKCSSRMPLTSIDGDKLIINKKHKASYLWWWQNDIQCCYQRITRAGSNETADNVYSLSTCTNFVSGHTLDSKDEFILVSCVGYFNARVIKHIQFDIYKNAHAIIMPKESVNEKFKANNKNSSSMNVLLIGIDSISRLNLIRSMPKTFKYLKDNNWYDMRVFNKMAYNTFPNLMAILTGLNESAVEHKCHPRYVGKLEKCKFLWTEFSDANYATAYAEDSMYLTTFNYYNTGFIKEPTDYYFRPFALAAEDFLKRSFEKPWLSMCLGYEHYADFIYRYAVDFSKKYLNDSFFGLFWTNSFSHDVLSMPSAYDERMKFYLQQLEEQGTLNNTIVMFFSDHGMRFGGIRKFFTGWLEERMPYLFFWLPEKFRDDYPELTENLKVNEYRLISPFDLHVTMKHILKLYGKYSGELSAESCEKCQSVFNEVPHNRTCYDAGISNVWCACSSFNETDHKSKSVENAAKFAVKVLNTKMSHLKSCAKLNLNKISSARESKHGLTTNYLVSFDVLPSKGQMEATVRCSENCKELEIVGEVSRINRYGNQSWCISDSHLRNYCFCK